MKLLKLNLNDNPRNSDPTVGFFKAVTRADSKLKPTNTRILKVQSFESGDYPNRAIVTLCDINDRLKTYQFIYDRFNVNDLLEDHSFTNSEADQILETHSSEVLLNILAVTLNVNFQPDGFFTHPNALELTGGYEGINFLLETSYDNLWFTGKRIIDIKPDEPLPV